MRFDILEQLQYGGFIRSVTPVSECHCTRGSDGCSQAAEAFGVPRCDDNRHAIFRQSPRKRMTKPWSYAYDQSYLWFLAADR